MKITLRRTEDGEYRATTPAGNEVEIFSAWTCGGWMIVRADRTPIGACGEEGIHEANLANVRETIGLGFCD